MSILQPTAKDWASIFALGMIWGGTFMAVSVALTGYGPLTVACARTTLGAIMLLAVMVALKRPLPGNDVLPFVVWIGVLNSAIPFALLSWGQQYVSSAFAGISMAALPLFVLPLAHLFSDEKMSMDKGIGVTVGFSGALILIGPGVLRIGTGWEPLGQFACLLAALSYAISSVMIRRCPPIDPLVLSALCLIVGSLILMPAMLLFEGIPVWSGGKTGLAILVLGLVSTAFATLLRTMVIQSAGSVFMTLVNYQVPLWAMLFGWAVLSEDLPWRFFVALALILTGMAISQSGSLRRLVRSISTA